MGSRECRQPDDICLQRHLLHHLPQCPCRHPQLQGHRRQLEQQRWGGNGADGNYEFTLDVKSAVTITFDPTTKEIAVSFDELVASYTVSFNGTNVTSNGASKAYNGVNYTATLTPAPGYAMPRSITVKVGITTLAASGYTYDSATGQLTINGSYITGNVTINAVAIEDYYIIAGTQDLTGSDWDITDTDNLMTKNADGTYSIVYQNVAAGNYEIKAVKNGSYDIGQWPYSGNKTFTVDKTSTVTVTLDLTTNELTVDVDEIVYTYDVTFSGSNVTSNGASTAKSNANYTATLTPASGYHLLSVTVKVGGAAIVDGYTFDSSTGALTIDESKITGNITITAVAEEDYYILAGSQSLTGSNWDITDTDNLMTKNADGTYTIVYDQVAAGSYKAKAVKNGSYDIGQWPYHNDLTVDVAETSRVFFTLDLSANELTVEVISLVSHYTVTFNGTNVTSNGSAGADDEHDYAATLSTPAGYRLPASITVTIGGSPLSTDSYTYDRSSGALTIDRSKITGDIVITAVADDSVYIIAGSEGLTGSSWDIEDLDNQMTKNADGTYTIVYSTVPAGSYRFKVVEDGRWKWPNEDYELDLELPSNVTITYDPATGNGSVDIEKLAIPEKYDRIDEISLDPKKTFYVGADIVDYLNDDRVVNGQIYGYYSNNQGIWHARGDSPYSYLNDLISQQVGNSNYTFPLYFGPLNYIESRYSRIVGDAATYYDLARWNSAVNVAMANTDGSINSDAAIQGLVGSTLLNGDLTDPVTGGPLLYFNKEAADTWTNQGGYYPVMAYYKDLKFPFKMESNDRVTTYSYDSATDYAVYYDYEHDQLYASSQHILDSIADDNTDPTDYGFYPLNEPDDSDNEVNNGFGIKFSIDFTVGKDGLLSNGEPVTFDFTGDDDVWIFIDGVLVLDMGGAHGKASGNINFHDQLVTVNDSFTADRSQTLTSGSSYAPGTYVGRSNSYLYTYVDGVATEERAAVSAGTKTATFQELDLTDFDYDSVHTMTVFYIERGMIESNFSMEFTMFPVPSGLTLSKKLNDDEINGGLLDAVSRADDLTFNMEASSPDSTDVSFSLYSLTDKYTGNTDNVPVEDATSGNTDNVPVEGATSGSTYTAAINGINNYVYAHGFINSDGEDAFIPGTTFTITETTKNLFQYSATSWAVYDAKNHYDNITDSVALSDTDAATASFIMGTAGDNVAYSYAVTFTNTMELGSLHLTKRINSPMLEDTDFRFLVYLDLDGSGPNFSEQLYKKLEYTVDGQTFISSDGSVTVNGAGTAIISGIPIGATYRIVEDIPTNATWTQVSKTGDAGSITKDAVAEAVFTNAMQLGSLTLTKDILDSALSATDFLFQIYVDLDGSGDAYTEELYTDLKYTVDGQTYTSQNGTVTLSGGKTAKINDLPAGATYRIVEQIPADAPWELVRKTNDTGSIIADTTAQVSFTNALKPGTLMLTKNINNATLSSTPFAFQVYLDLDGNGNAYSETLFTDLQYTVDGQVHTSQNGTVTLTGAGTAIINDLPAGATYRIVEQIPADAPWELVRKTNDTGSIIANGTVEAVFTNAASVTVHKTIYVQAGAPTKYTISHDGNVVTVGSMEPSSGLTATKNGTEITFIGQEPGQAYTMDYGGTLTDGTVVSGTVTVYTFKAMDKIYVFDFGLTSDLADTDYGYGLFQQDHLFNKDSDGTTASIASITSSNNDETEISYTPDAQIEKDGSSSEPVYFRPVAFMSKPETYTYTVQITAPVDGGFVKGDPETGCTVSGTITVMPANSVYYEDNFNVDGTDASKKFIYSGTAPSESPSISQSNDQGSNYGHDGAYKDNFADSNNSSTELSHLDYTYFTFTGTGFDLDSRTNSTTAGMAVYVFQGKHKQEYLDWVTDLSYTSDSPPEPVHMTFVNNYYANGDLYQVPVVSVRLDQYSTYTVYIQSLSTTYGDTVYIDGVRIYHPLGKNTTAYPLPNELGIGIDELRILYKDGMVGHALKYNDKVATGFGKGSIVEQITGGHYSTATELMNVYLTGPNNEMYLPANCGLRFRYTPTSDVWTLQLGAKSVTAENDAKTISIWARTGTAAYEPVGTIKLETTTDLYYDLTDMLEKYSDVGTSYDVIIISEATEDFNNEFVSLTTLKHSGLELEALD